MAKGETSVAGIVLLVLGILALLGGIVDLIEVYLVYTAFGGFLGPGIWMVPGAALSFGVLLTSLGAYLMHHRSGASVRRRPVATGRGRR